MSKKIIFLLILLGVIELLLLAYYFFQSSQTPSQQNKITQSKTENQIKENVIDILALPGWPSSSETFIRLPNGSVQITSPDTSSELRLINRTDSIEIGNGLELFVKMNAVSKADPSSPRTARIILFDGQLANEQKIDPKEIHIGFDQGKNVVVDFLDINLQDPNERRKYLITPQDGKELSSDELKVEIAKVGQDMILNIFDGATGELLVKDLKAPIPVLSNNLNLGFYPQAGDRNGVILKVNKFGIVNK